MQSYVQDADNNTKEFNNQKKLSKGPPQQKSVKTLFKRIKAKESDQCDYVTNSVLSSSNRQKDVKYDPPNIFSA